VGFIEDAISRAAELAGLSKDNYRVVEFEPPATLADALVGSVQSPRHPLDAQSLLELSTPRAYYLYSWLPPLSP
jgi:protease-4